MKFSIFLFFLTLSIHQVVSQASFPFVDDFDNSSFNLNHWSPFPNKTGIDGVVDVFSGIGFNNSNGVRIGKLNGASAFTTNALDLHIDLSNQSEVEMTFWIADVADETHVLDGIYFSDDG